MSKHSSDLCTLLIDESYGQLASKIYQTLLVHGRCTPKALGSRTRLDLTEIHQALAVLSQNFLVYWIDPQKKKEEPVFAANVEAAYSLVRYGKWIQIVEDRYGDLAGRIISQLLLLGHGTVSDFVVALQPSNDTGFSIPKTPLVNGNGTHHLKKNGRIVHESDSSSHQIHQTFCDLLQVGVICKCQPSHCHSDTDNRTAAEEQVKPEKDFPGKTKGERVILREQAVQRRLDDEKYGTAEEREEISKLQKGPKRLLNDSESTISSKRARLNGSHVATSTHQSSEHSEIGSAPASFIKDDLTFRVNHTKLAVLLRNRHLVMLAKDSICDTTSKVYQKVLEMLEPQVRECRNKRQGKSQDEEDKDEEHTQHFSAPYKTTEEIAAVVPESSDLYDALGTLWNPEPYDRGTEHPKKQRKKANGIDDELSHGSDKSMKEENGVNDTESESDSDATSDISYVSEDSNKATADAAITPLNRVNGTVFLTPHQKVVRSHLLLLSHHPLGFLTHLRGTMTDECWNVRFPKLTKKVQNQTIAQTISSRYGTHSVRLAKILEQHGKLDEKTLSAMSLIREKDMRHHLTPMHQAGLIELQEVPRDNARIATKTNFLFFFDQERCMSKLTGECYKTMTRLMERTRIERGKVQGVLDKASRSDVVGREKEMLNLAEQQALEQWKTIEEKLMGQVGRIDDTVVVFQDF